jgi:hypothetical protein
MIIQQDPGGCEKKIQCDSPGSTEGYVVTEKNTVAQLRRQLRARLRGQSCCKQVRQDGAAVPTESWIQWVSLRENLQETSGTMGFPWFSHEI